MVHTMLCYFSRVHLDHECSVIEVFDSELATGKSSQKVNLNFNNEVILLSAESVMRFLFDNDDNISGFCCGRLVGFAPENDGLATFHSFIDVDLQHFLVGNNLLALTIATAISGVDKLASSSAVITSSLDLLNHWTHLTHNNLDATSMTARAGPHCTFLSSLAFAFGAENIARQCEFCGLAFVQLLKGDVYTMNKVFCFTWALGTATATTKEAARTAEELAEKILQESQ